MNWPDEAWEMHERIVKKWPVGSAEDKHFIALALAGEVGELLNLIKKRWRGDLDVPRPGVVDLRQEEWESNVEEELADVRIYLELLARLHGVNLDEACAEKMVELRTRWPKK